MTFLATLIGFFKFFDECYTLIQGLKQTPAEKHEAVMAKVTGVFDETNSTHPDRPSWDVK